MHFRLSRRLWAIAPVIGLLLLSATLPVRGDQEPPAPPTPDTPIVPTRPSTDPRLRTISEALRNGQPAEAARLLKAIDVHTLDPIDGRRWRLLASQAALRTGDRAWLEEIARDPERFSNTLTLITVTVAQLLRDGEFDDARALLARIKDPEHLDEISRRRYLQLHARLEQLTGNAAAERNYVAKLVDFAGRWPSSTCQACHANPNKFGEQVTTLNVADWWVGDRFTQLLKASGDATRVRAAAEKRLAQAPDDASAKLRLAYALRAEGGANVARADALLRTLSWAEFPNREKRAPLRFTTFP